MGQKPAQSLWFVQFSCYTRRNRLVARVLDLMKNVDIVKAWLRHLLTVNQYKVNKRLKFQVRIVWLMNNCHLVLVYRV